MLFNSSSDGFSHPMLYWMLMQAFIVVGECKGYFFFNFSHSAFFLCLCIIIFTFLGIF